MKIHLCKEKPCPVEEKEYADRLSFACTTNYSNMELLPFQQKIMDYIMSRLHGRTKMREILSGYSNWEERFRAEFKPLHISCGEDGCICKRYSKLKSFISQVYDSAFELGLKSYPGYSNWEEQGEKYGYFNYYKEKQDGKLK